MSEAAAWGIAGSYTDAHDERQRVSRAVQRELLAAMEIEPGTPPPRPDIVRVARPGDALPVPGELLLEDGTSLVSADRLPRDVAFGYHRLRREAGETLLLVAPPRAHLPRDMRAWGWAVQLHAARSRRSWGIGDLADLALLARATASQGGGFLAVSPIWAPNPGPEPEPSPYYPSTRRFRSPLYLRMEDLPPAVDLGSLGGLASRGRALNADARIDRARILELKLRALQAAWSAAASAGAPTDARCAAYRSAQGEALQQWAVFVTLGERFGPGWQRWPEEYRRPDAPAVRRFAGEHADRLAFHSWIQWLLDEQLAAAAAAAPSLRLIGDLPVGVDPGGFDAWAWQQQLALGASVGAPPDRFNTAGQDWDLPPFVPHRLRAAGYRPFIDTVRAAMRHSGGLRIDHVLGLFRMWWMPRGAGPRGGGYVRYPVDELLAILAIESHRSRAIIIGEDLGTVPRGVRSRLARANVLSTRLLYFERRPPAAWPRLALSAISTHDLPTVVGTWTGADLADQAAAGVEPDTRGLDELRGRLASRTGLPPSADPRDVILAAHAAVAASPSVLAMASLEDALAMAERPNIPGTVAPQRDNWSIALPMSLEELMLDPFVRRLAAALRR